MTPAPRPRLTLRSTMIAVAVAAVLSLLLAKLCLDCRNDDERLVILAACLVGAAFGLGSARHPGPFLLFLIVVGLYTPTMHHSLSLTDLCLLGWVIGAPAGFLSRYLRDRAAKDPLRAVPNQPPDTWEF